MQICNLKVKHQWCYFLVLFAKDQENVIAYEKERETRQPVRDAPEQENAVIARAYKPKRLGNNRIHPCRLTVRCDTGEITSAKWRFVPLSFNHGYTTVSADLFLWPLDDDTERPTVAEIQLALSRLDGYRVVCDPPCLGQWWFIEVHANNDESQDTYLAIRTGADGDNCNICFETGEVITIAYVASVIATITGPLALYHASSSEPLVTLYPNMTYNEVCEAVGNV